MLNRQFVLLKLNKYLNSAREISAEEFELLFSELTKREQYKVIDIMIEENIQYVDEKTPEETKQTIESAGIKTGYSLKQEDYLSCSSAMLCKLYQEGNNIALEALIKKNEKFIRAKVTRFLSKFSGMDLTEDDLYQEGVLGLIKSAKKFDITRDNAFLTYADSWISQSIIRAIYDTGFLVRLPVHVYERIFRVIKMKKLFPDFTPAALTDKINEHYPDKLLNEHQVKMALEYADIYLNTLSLNLPVNEDEDNELIDFIPDDQIPSPYKTVELSDESNNLKYIIYTLQPREIIIILMRYGFWSGVPMTLDNIGTKFGLTRERIRQIENKALRKLRHPSRLKLITGGK